MNITDGRKLPQAWKTAKVAGPTKQAGCSFTDQGGGKRGTKIGPLVAALSREETLRGDEHPKHSGRNV
jgi:hypothetical protein